MKGNFILQTMLMIGAIFIMFAAVADQSFLVLLLMLQVPVGIIQYLASTFTYFLSKDINGYKHFKIHWILSSLYLVSLIAFTVSGSSTDFDIFAITGLLIIPWLLAFYYWYCTYLASGFGENKIYY